MFVLRLLLVVGVLLSGCAAAPSPSVIDKVKRAVVSITYQKGEMHGVCTGFFIGRGQVLTAEHCLPGDVENPKVNILFSVKIVKRDANLILLETNLPTPGILSFGKQPKLGEDIASMGYAYGGPLLVYVRSVAGYVGDNLIVDGPLSGGMSGGPIVNKKGEVVGVNQGSNPIIGLATSAEEIKEFLK